MYSSGALVHSSAAMFALEASSPGRGPRQRGGSASLTRQSTRPMPRGPPPRSRLLIDTSPPRSWPAAPRPCRTPLSHTNPNPPRTHGVRAVPRPRPRQRPHHVAVQRHATRYSRRGVHPAHYRGEWARLRQTWLRMRKWAAMPSPSAQGKRPESYTSRRDRSRQNGGARDPFKSNQV
ncbi:MAG: hypothetical protein J3K34DRAFT_406214 [Monoraphidium minutum]|nr:MAG: hypothetical protein J3K34DRAFT_406214 [Monoraphidium minutum]